MTCSLASLAPGATMFFDFTVRLRVHDGSDEPLVTTATGIGSTFTVT